MQNYNNAVKFIKDFFIDKKIENNEALRIYSDFNCYTQDIINFIMSKNIDYTNFYEYIEKISKNYINFNNSFKEEKILSFDECKNASSWYNLPNVKQNDRYWRYQGPINDRDIIEGARRPFAIKLRINAYSLDEADKYWEVVEPILREHKVCFKFPKDIFRFEENLKGIEAGKFITIYTKTDEEAIFFAKKLNDVLEKNNIQIKEKSNILNVDVPIGNTGILSAVIDKDFNGCSIQEFEGKRQTRRDIFFRLKDMLDKEGLLYGKSLYIIDNKIKNFGFDKYINFDKKILLEDENNLYNINYFIATINQFSKEDFLGDDCIKIFTNYYPHKGIDLIQYYNTVYGKEDCNYLLDSFVKNLNYEFISCCLIEDGEEISELLDTDIKNILYEKYNEYLDRDSLMSNRYGTLFISKCIIDNNLDDIENLIYNSKFEIDKDLILSLSESKVLIYLRDNYNIDFADNFNKLNFLDNKSPIVCGISSLLEKGMDKELIIDKIIESKNNKALKSFLRTDGFDFLIKKEEEFLQKNDLESVSFIKNIRLEKECDMAWCNLDFSKLSELYKNGYTDVIEKNNFQVKSLFSELASVYNKICQDDEVNAQKMLLDCFKFISITNIYDKIDLNELSYSFEFTNMYEKNKDLFNNFFKLAVEDCSDTDYIEKINYFVKEYEGYDLSKDLKEVVPIILLCDSNFSKKLIEQTELDNYSISSNIPRQIYENIKLELNENSKNNLVL